jgi:hypothetical protein
MCTSIGVEYRPYKSSDSTRKRCEVLEQTRVSRSLRRSHSPADIAISCVDRDVDRELSMARELSVCACLSRTG